jgi:hypothetical protein
MDENLRFANQSLVEGDRDRVLTITNRMIDGSEVLWLKAHAVNDEEKRIERFNHIAKNGHGTYADLANKIVRREQEYKRVLSEPPDYQFWKKGTWRERFQHLREKAPWLLWLLIIGAGFTVFLLVSLISKPSPPETAGEVMVTPLPAEIQNPVSGEVENPAAQVVVDVKPTPSVTPLPPNRRGMVTYPAGSLAVYRLEMPTDRLVTYHSYGSESPPATPPVGSRFVAVEFEFICKLPVCKSPPEAQVDLRLKSGQTISYESLSDIPKLIEAPEFERVALNQKVNGWFVYEVPDLAIPDALIVIYEDESEEIIREIKWPGN